MTDETGWMWWVGKEEDRFHTACNSRDEAVYIATEEQEGGWIVEAKQPTNIQLSTYFIADDFLDAANEMACDLCDPEGDTGVFDPREEPKRGLETAVRAAIDAWQAQHNLVFTVWTFSAQRNLQYIPPKEEA